MANPLIQFILILGIGIMSCKKRRVAQTQKLLIMTLHYLIIRKVIMGYVNMILIHPYITIQIVVIIMETNFI